MKSSIYSFLAVVTLFTMSACSSSTPPPSTPTGPKTPGRGSAFNTTEHDTTSSGTTSALFTDSVVASGITYGGKSNVVEFYSLSHGVVLDSSFSTYESNGDISIMTAETRVLSQFFPSITWVKMTVASQATDTLAAKDTTFYANGIPVAVHFSLISRGTGTGSTVVNGNTLTTQSATLSVIGTVMATGQQYVLRQAMITFSPTIGYIVFRTEPALPAAPLIGSLQPNGVYTELTSYTEF